MVSSEMILGDLWILIPAFPKAGPHDLTVFLLTHYGVWRRRGLGSINTPNSVTIPRKHTSWWRCSEGVQSFFTTLRGKLPCSLNFLNKVKCASAPTEINLWKKLNTCYFKGPFPLLQCYENPASCGIQRHRGRAFGFWAIPAIPKISTTRTFVSLSKAKSSRVHAIAVFLRKVYRLGWFVLVFASHRSILWTLRQFNI